MSTFKNLLKYINEDFIAPTVRLIVISKKEILLNKIVPKKSSIREIFRNEGIVEGKQYTLSGKPLNLDDKIIDIIPKNYDTLSNIELIVEETNLLIEDTKIYYEKILKPLENPFRILVFTPNEFDVSIKTYPNETIEMFQLNNYLENSSSYCNTPKDLYISGGNKNNQGLKNFWRINSIKTNIEKLKDLPIDKENHSMIYIPKRYIYFIGGNNKNTFYYDELFNTFTSWAEMNKQVKSPSLIFVNNTFIYSFGEQNENSQNDFFERTNLKSTKPSWEIINLEKNVNFPMKNFCAAIADDNEIYFLGGRQERRDKIYKYNLSTLQIEKCKQENTTLKPIDKNFYPLNDYNSAIIPETKIGKNIQVIIFNRKRKKYRKVLYEKNLDEIVNNYDLSLEDSLIKENNQVKIIWKEFQNNYISIDNLPENMLYLPSIEDLKKAAYNENINSNKDMIETNNDNFGNIYSNEYQNKNKNILRKGGKRDNNPEDTNIINNKEGNLNQNQLDFKNKTLKEKLISEPGIESNNISITLKQLFNMNINDNISIKTIFKDYSLLNIENIKGMIYGQNEDKNKFIVNIPKRNDININITPNPNKDFKIGNAEIELNKKYTPLDNNKSISLQDIIKAKESIQNTNTLKEIFNGKVDDNINLKFKKPKIMINDDFNLNGNIKGIEIDDGKELSPILLKKKTIILDQNKNSIPYKIEYEENKNNNPLDINISKEGIIKGNIPEIEGNLNINKPKIEIQGQEKIKGNIPGINKDINIQGPTLENIIASHDTNLMTLKGLFGGDVNDTVYLNKENIKLKENKIESTLGYIKGINPSENIDINIPNINIDKPKLRVPNLRKGKIEGNIPDIDINGPKIEGNIPDIDINGPKIEGNIPDIKGNVDISGPQIGENIEGRIPDFNGTININEPKIEGENIKGNISGFSKSIKINGPSIEGNLEKIINGELPNTLKVLFSGDINDDIKLNKIQREKLEEYPLESIFGRIEGIAPVNYGIEYGSTKGYKRPEIKKGKDFEHNPEIVIEGTIEGKKKVPPTLQSIFGEDINGRIHLNNNLYKKPEYQIGENITGYIDREVSGNIDMNMPNLNIQGPNLRAGKGINGNINIPSGEIIEGNIPGIGGSVNINGPKLKGNRRKYKY